MPAFIIRNRTSMNILRSIFLIFLMTLVLTACEKAVRPKPVVVSKQVPVEPVKVKPPVAEVPEVRKKEGVIILLSSDAEAYQQLANRLSRKLGKQAIQMTMNLRPAENRALLDSIRESDKEQVVALGLAAAKLVKDLDDKQVVFAQVINHGEYSFISDNMKGISALPAPEQVFRDWKAIYPALSSVAIVAGDNLDSFMEQAEKAASEQGIRLEFKQVKTDKEFIYQSKNIPLDIEGQWILPDYRVLSVKALKEVMAYASRRGRQIAVFSPKLLPFGGLFYVDNNEAAVVQAIVKRLEQASTEEHIPGAGIVEVLRHDIEINPKIARQLNLKIPAGYREFVHGE